MNRLVLIGNGFDLAHNLRTSYNDFIDWYWEKTVNSFYGNLSSTAGDILCKFIYLEHGVWNVFANNYLNPIKRKKGGEIIDSIINNKEAFKVRKTDFFENITHCIETKGWVDIENEYYHLLKQCSTTNQEGAARKLNEELKYLQDLLVEYLSSINSQEIEIKKSINQTIYEPINPDDIAIEATSKWNQWIKYWEEKDEKAWRTRLYDFGIEDSKASGYVFSAEDYLKSPDSYDSIPALFRFPENIMLLSFNYTKTAQLYLHPNRQAFSINYIHGQLDQPESIIFGHGDEMDEQFKQMQNLNNQEFLKNIKSINYMKSDNYKKVLSFIESAPFQIYILGHSCGISDRTLLNTLFEHENCVSIKPFYYLKEDNTDNYLELVQNISRNFNSMKLMRDRVVNKTCCKPVV